MKKKFIVGIVLAVVLLAVISTAGCVQQKEVTEDTIDFSKINVTVEYYVMKKGITYNVGDTMLVIFPAQEYFSNWEVKSCEDGLSISEDGYISVLMSTFGYKTFTITALKEGNYSFTLVDAKKGGEYFDTVHVVKTDDAPLTPRGVFMKQKLLQRDPAVGDACEISIYKEPSTEYQWCAQKTEGLIISDPVYAPLAEDGSDRDGGFVSWKVTAATPGEYAFTALNQREGDSESAGRVIVSLKFREREN